MRRRRDLFLLSFGFRNCLRTVPVALWAVITRAALHRKYCYRGLELNSLK